MNKEPEVVKTPSHLLSIAIIQRIEYPANITPAPSIALFLWQLYVVILSETMDQIIWKPFPARTEPQGKAA